MAEFGESLSPRETDVLHEMVAGGSNKEIATALSISPNTVKVHVRNIFTKMGAASRTEAVTLGLQQGLIDGVELVEEEEALTPQPPLPLRGGEEATLEIIGFPQQVDEFETATVIEQAADGEIVRQPVVDSSATSKFRPIYLLPILLTLLVGSFFAYQQFSAPEPTTFIETELGERGWWQAQPLDAPRAGMATVGDGLNIYRIGGQCDPSFCDSAESIDGSTATYDRRENHWRTLADKPTAVTDAAAAVVAGQIYVVGGTTSTGATATMEVYSPASDAWRPASSLPTALTGAVAVSNGEFLYVVGGENAGGISAETFIYNPIDDSWRPLPPLPTARSFAAGAFLLDSIYVVGGRNETGELDSCERFDTMIEEWESCPPLLQARAGAQALSIFGKLYVLGGGFDSTVTTGELFDSNSNSWSVVNVPIDTSWTRLGLANIETRIYLFGGERDGQLQTEMLAFDPLTFQIFLPSTRNER